MVMDQSKIALAQDYLMPTIVINTFDDDFPLMPSISHSGNLTFFFALIFFFTLFIPVLFADLSRARNRRLI